MKTAKWVIVTVVLGCLQICGCVGLRQNTQGYESKLNAFLTPGMHIDEAASEIQKREFRDISVNRVTGYLDALTLKEVGEMSILFTVDEYWEGFLMKATIEGRVAFDKEGRLIGTSIRKTVDAP